MLEADSELYNEGGFTRSTYLANCKARQADAVSGPLAVDSRGFTSEVELDKENLVFYAVPYDEGWSVTVDGEKAEIVRANVGFMAVDVPAGSHTVRFTYRTPGLVAGIAVGIGGMLLLAGYLVLMTFLRKRKPAEPVCDIEREALETAWAAQDEAERDAFGDCLSPVDLPAKPKGGKHL